MRFFYITISIAFVISLFHPNAVYSADFVNPKQQYTYKEMTIDLHELAKAYPQITELQSIGKTKFDRDIWALKLGTGQATVLINASHHAREWLTTNVVMEMIDVYTDAFENEKVIGGYDVKELLSKTSIWFVPMVNPDGVSLQQLGLKAFPKEAHSSLLEINGGWYDFKRWKANSEGIDLNRQYPAAWETLTGVVPLPNYKLYKGEKPLQAKEAQLMVDFTYKINPEIAVSYHTAGQIVYWHEMKDKEKTHEVFHIVERFADLTGYGSVKTRYDKWGGGFSDWFILEFNRPAFTPEIALYNGENSVKLSDFIEAWKRNKPAGLLFAQEGYKLWEKRRNANVLIWFQGLQQKLNQWEDLFFPIEIIN
jgi:g-D-glutamyl-meso-diaminopimelate peptidase